MIIVSLQLITRLKIQLWLLLVMIASRIIVFLLLPPTIAIHQPCNNNSTSTLFAEAVLPIFHWLLTIYGIPWLDFIVIHANRWVSFQGTQITMAYVLLTPLKQASGETWSLYSLLFLLRRQLNTIAGLCICFRDAVLPWLQIKFSSWIEAIC